MSSIPVAGGALPIANLLAIMSTTAIIGKFKRAEDAEVSAASGHTENAHEAAVGHGCLA